NVQICYAFFLTRAIFRTKLSILSRSLLLFPSQVVPLNRPFGSQLTPLRRESSPRDKPASRFKEQFAMKLTECSSVGLAAVVVTLAISIGASASDPQKHARSEPTRYTILDIGTLGGTFSAARGINDKGWVSGSSTLPGDLEEHTFLWRDGEM